MGGLDGIRGVIVIRRIDISRVRAVPLQVQVSEEGPSSVLIN